MTFLVNSDGFSERVRDEVIGLSNVLAFLLPPSKQGHGDNPSNAPDPHYSGNVIAQRMVRVAQR